MIRRVRNGRTDRRRWFLPVLAIWLAACGSDGSSPATPDDPIGVVELHEIPQPVDVDSVEEGTILEELEAHLASIGARVNRPDPTKLGMTAVVYFEGEPRYFGYGAFSEENVAEPKTVLLGIGSNSKVLTGSLLAVLHEEGKVGLSDAMEDWISAQYQDDAGSITLEMLATHASSLPRVANNQGATPTTYSVSDLETFLGGFTPGWPIGTEYLYSNIAFGALGIIVGKAGGGSFDDYESEVKKKILDTLGMESTTITLPSDVTPAPSYSILSQPAAHPAWTEPTIEGAGAWYSTAEDMGTFLAAQVSSSDDALHRALRTTHKPRFCYDPSGSEEQPAVEDKSSVHCLGLGWFVHKDTGFVQKNGAIFGYNSAMGFDPVSGSGVMLLHNSGLDGASGALVDGVVELLTLMHEATARR